MLLDGSIIVATGGAGLMAGLIWSGTPAPVGRFTRLRARSLPFSRSTRSAPGSRSFLRSHSLLDRIHPVRVRRDQRNDRCSATSWKQWIGPGLSSWTRGCDYYLIADAVEDLLILDARTCAQSEHQVNSLRERFGRFGCAWDGQWPVLFLDRGDHAGLMKAAITKALTRCLAVLNVIGGGTGAAEAPRASSDVISSATGMTVPNIKNNMVAST